MEEFSHTRLTIVRLLLRCSMIRRFLLERHLGKAVEVIARREDVVPSTSLSSSCWPSDWEPIEVREGERLTFRLTLGRPAAGSGAQVFDAMSPDERLFDDSELMFLREAVTDLKEQLREGERERLRLLKFLPEAPRVEACGEMARFGGMRCGLWRDHPGEHMYPENTG